MGKSFFEAERKESGSLLAVSCATTGDGKATMTVTESKGLKKGTRVYWRGDAADSGVVTETSWAAVTITWDNGQVAICLRLMEGADVYQVAKNTSVKMIEEFYASHIKNMVN